MVEWVPMGWVPMTAVLMVTKDTEELLELIDIQRELLSWLYSLLSWLLR